MRLNRKRMTSVAILPSFIFIESSCVFPIYCDKFYLTLKPLQFRTSPLISSVLHKYKSQPMAVISQYLGGVMTFPLGDINPYQPSSASYFFCNLQSFDKVLVMLLPFYLLNYPHHHSSLPQYIVFHRYHTIICQHY